MSLLLYGKKRGGDSCGHELFNRILLYHKLVNDEFDEQCSCWCYVFARIVYIKPRRVCVISIFMVIGSRPGVLSSIAKLSELNG